VARHQPALTLSDVAKRAKSVVFEVEEPVGVIERLPSPAWDDWLHAGKCYPADMARPGDFVHAGVSACAGGVGVRSITLTVSKMHTPGLGQFLPTGHTRDPNRYRPPGTRASNCERRSLRSISTIRGDGSDERGISRDSRRSITVITAWQRPKFRDQLKKRPQMKKRRASNDCTINENTVLAGGFALEMAAFVAALTLIISSREAAATYEYSQQTGLPCNQCHASGGTLTPFGEKFKANGNKLPKPDQR
jgi:hypothetical protein